MEKKYDFNYNESTPSLLINIIPLIENTDLEELERDTQNLYDDLSHLDSVDNVNLVTKGTSPKESKSGTDVVIWGSLLVTLSKVALSSSSIIIPNLVDTLQSWIKRNDNKKISLKIGEDELEVTGLSDMEQQRLIDAWISKCMKKN